MAALRTRSRMVWIEDMETGIGNKWRLVFENGWVNGGARFFRDPKDLMIVRFLESSRSFGELGFWRQVAEVA